MTITTTKRLMTVLLAAAHCFWGAALLSAQPAETETPEPADQPSEMEAAEDSERSSDTESDRQHIRHSPIVKLGGDAHLKAGHKADAVVVINGNAKIDGAVRDAVVTIGGDIEVNGEVRDVVVAILGNVRAGQGASIGGDVVTVGGTFEHPDEFDLNGTPVEIDLGRLGEGLKQWIIHCVLKLRPLAPQVGWVWVVAGFFFLIYLLVAAILPAPVQACVNELTRRPVTTFFMGLVAQLLVPVVLVLLAITGVGAIVVPFLVAGVAFAAIIGKVALLERMGSGIGSRFGAAALQNPLAGFFLGVVILTVLYMVPVLGLITFGVVSLWGLGCAVSATFRSLKRQTPAPALAATAPTSAAAVSPAAPAMPPSSAPIPSEPSPLAPTATEPATQNPLNAAPGTPPIVSPPPMSLPEVVVYPKAAFWERMGAAFLDIVLISVIGGIIGSPPLTFLLGLAYFSGMWAWKGTTIGGIVLGLKVVRYDGQPVTFTVAIVRALAGAFSGMVAFLGFLWIAWDKDKQGWHDKIAGTIVLKLPRGTPLVCF